MLARAIVRFTSALRPLYVSFSSFSPVLRPFPVRFYRLFKNFFGYGTGNTDEKLTRNGREMGENDVKLM